MAVKSNKISFGARGEELAAKLLIAEGYKVIRRNYRVGRLGEIDIIAEDGDYLCFIEVKTRKDNSYGVPSEAVDARKQDKIRNIALIYLAANKKCDSNVRFDVVEILINKNNDGVLENKMNIIKNAF